MKNRFPLARSTLALASTLALLACEQPGGTFPQGTAPDTSGVYAAPGMLVTDAPRYESGNVVTLHLTNRTSRSVGFNLCRSSIELEREGDWQRTESALAEACTAEIRTLRPGQSTTYSVRMTQKRRGQYRIRTDLEDVQTRSRYTIVSNTFTLTRDEND